MMAIDKKQLSDAMATGVKGGAPTDRQSESLDRARAVSRRSQALLAAAGEEAPEAKWYVLTVRPGEDNAVDNALTNAGVGHWMATKTIEKRRRGGRKWQAFSPVMAPALPGYMFVHVPNLPMIWHALRGLDGVVDVLGGGLDPKPVLEREITKLQLFIEKDPKAIALLHNALQAGDRVSVDHGPLASFEGVVKLLGKAARLTVDVDIFGRTVPVDLELAQVRKLE